MKASKELKPCPFCNKQDLKIVPDPGDEKYYHIVCEHCGSLINGYRYIENLQIHWSMRPIEDALQAEIERLKARVAELEAQQRWIPVSERLPKHNQECITVHELQGYVEILGFRTHENKQPGDHVEKNTFVTKDDYGYEKSIKITHWMPLPIFPESEGE